MNTPLVLAADGAPALPAGEAVPAAPRPGLGQCLFLAALLHLWLVALVGTTPGGSAEPGDGAAMAPLRVRLQGSGPEDSPGRAARPLPETGPVGRAPEPRYGGAVREAPPQPSPEPGAAQLGQWGPQPAPDPLRPRAPTPVVPVDPAALPATPPQLTRDDLAPAPPPPLPAPLQRPAPVEAPPSPRVDAGSGPSTAPRLAPQDTLEAPVLQRPEQAVRDIANSARVPGTAAPQPAPAPQRDERVAAPLEPPRPSPAPPEPRAAEPTPPAPPPPTPVPVSPPPPAPAAAPAATPAPATLAAPPAEAARPQPTPCCRRPRCPRPNPWRRRRPLAPVAPPAPPAPVAPPLQPRAPVAPSLLRPDEATELPRAVASDAQAPPLRLPDVAPAAAPAARAGVLPVVPAPPGGAPTAGARLGSDRATAPSAAASSAPLRLDLPSARAPQPGLVNPRLLNLVPPPPERKSALSEGIEKSARPDCRKAYSGMGPLAVVPLAADALRDGGCRW
ncbi:MAG: hypothetical protein U1F56_07980 [Rubrivivax sp.]